MFKGVRNKIDFKIRRAFRWSPRLDDTTPVHDKALRFQTEVEEFLNLFNLKRFLPEPALRPLVAADVGARTFAMAPAIDRVFERLGFELTLHGIEIDAYRRFTNFLTRAEYGRYYAKKIRHGFYHALDFLEWRQPLDIIFMLHPFVSREPLINWGLPPEHFRPQEIFDHSFNLLSQNPKTEGLMILSCPTEEEFEVAHVHALKSGFGLLQKAHWCSKPGKNIQTKPRFGAIYGIVSAPALEVITP